ncbi:hypothetical protein CPB86DRAFT_871487 [Serendipita vermifera]|nr:hypothetical protein CPB86DRAFT_871487 [Serendipita vermifera]
MTTETRLPERISFLQYQGGSIMMTNPGNRGERPSDNHFLDKPDPLELLFKEWVSTSLSRVRTRFLLRMSGSSTTSSLHIVNVPLYFPNPHSLISIFYAICSDVIVDMVNIIKHEIRSAETFSEIVWEGLASILQVAKDWGLDLNITAIKRDYENARISDEQRKDSQLVQVMDTEAQEFRVAEMRSSRTQTRGPFELQGEKLDDIQQAILRMVGSSGDMELPDVWYPKSVHSLTERQLRWYLLEEDWMITEDYQPVQDSGPELYFVDITQPNQGSAHGINYAVVLLHYTRNMKELDEPVPIPWGTPCQTTPCGTLEGHLRHLEVTREWNTFTARDMDNDCGQYVSLIDNGNYSDIPSKSATLLNTPLQSHHFKKRHNELYLQCRM